MKRLQTILSLFSIGLAIAFSVFPFIHSASAGGGVCPNCISGGSYADPGLYNLNRDMADIVAEMNFQNKLNYVPLIPLDTGYRPIDNSVIYVQPQLHVASPEPQFALPAMNSSFPVPILSTNYPMTNTGPWSWTSDVGFTGISGRNYGTSKSYRSFLKRSRFY